MQLRLSPVQRAPAPLQPAPSRRQHCVVLVRVFPDQLSASSPLHLRSLSPRRIAAGKFPLYRAAACTEPGRPSRVPRSPCSCRCLLARKPSPLSALARTLIAPSPAKLGGLDAARPAPTFTPQSSRVV